MKKIIGLIAILFCLAIVPSYKAAAATEPQVQVKLVNYLGNQSSISLKIAGSYYLNGSSPNLLIRNKSYTVKVENGALSLYDGNTKLTAGADISITPVNSIDHAIINNREYAGSFHFTLENEQYVRPINTINLEDYVKSVVPAEMPGTWPTEALKSQAIAARTFAYFRLNKTINDTTTFQVYGGVSSLYPKASNAVDSTAGQILTYNGNPVDAVFSASNGGKTENQFDTLNPTPIPYTDEKKDDYDTTINWDVTVHKQQINTTSLDLKNPDSWWNSTNEQDADVSASIKSWLFNKGYKQTKIVGIPKLSFYNQTASGRYFRGDLTVQFFVKDMLNANGELALQTIDVTNELTDNIRYILNSKYLKSNLFTFTDGTDAYTFNGHGYGHGVGLSQYGANARAVDGILYNDILTFYYPGTVLTSQYVPADRSKLRVGWISWGGKWYYFNSNGSMKTGWLSYKNHWYFMDNNGVMRTGWIYDSGRSYYLDSTGAMKTGWLYYGNKWYYLDPVSGAMKKGWVKSGYKWYYLDNSGVMKTGWVYLGYKWYYLDPGTGAMKTGWAKINNKWYYFYSSGVMAANTTIQGYKINQYGVWVG